MDPVPASEVTGRLAEAGRGLAAVLDLSPTALVGCDAEGRVEALSAAGARLLGDAVGRPLVELVAPEDRPRVERLLERLEAGERVPPLDLRLATPARVTAHAAVADARDEGPRVWLALEELTDGRRVDRLLEAERSMLERIARGEPLADVLEALIRSVEELSEDGVLGSVLLLDERGERLRVAAGPRLPEAYNRAIDGVRIGPEVGACGRAAYLGEEVVAEDLRTDPRWAPFRELAEEHGLRACWSTPILTRDERVLGTFAMYYRRPGRPSEADEDTVALVARTAAVAIESARGQQALLEKTRSLELIDRVTQSLVAELELEPLVQQLTDAGTELCGAAFGAFFYNVVGRDGDSYQLYTLSGAPREAFERFPMPRSTEIFGPTFRGEGLIRLDDVTQDPRYGRNPPYSGTPEGHLPVRSYLALPVRSRSGEVLGGLFFGHPEPGRFSERHENVLRAVAAQASIAIDNARLYETARQHAADLEEAARRKDEFLALLGHELRNPLSALVNALALLDRSEDPDVVALAREILGRQSGQMVRMVDDLLDVSRITRGKIRLQREAADLVEVVRRAVLAARPAYAERRQELELHVPDAPCPASVDVVRVEQVLGNLLQNASKFSPDDARVRVVLEAGEAEATIRVVDEGEGIAADALPHVFDAFYQGHQPGRQAHSGLGVGLMLVRTLVHLHGGSASAESEGPGRGSTFVVSLPLARGDAVAGEGPEERTPSARDVLLVEDHADARESLHALLAGEGHRVRTAADGADALRLAAEAPPSVVLLDVGLPDLDGTEVARRLRADPALGRTRIVALTGFGQDALGDEASARFDAHLTKPVALAELRRVLAEG